MQTKYEPQKFEKEIYKNWEEGGYFKAMVNEIKNHLLLLCHHQILQENYTWAMP